MAKQIWRTSRALLKAVDVSSGFATGDFCKVVDAGVEYGYVYNSAGTGGDTATYIDATIGAGGWELQTSGNTIVLGTDENYVTDAEKIVISNTSGTNTGDQDLSGKQDILTAASQVEMEAGTETAIRSMSPLRVAQAVAALSTGGSLPVGGTTGQVLSKVSATNFDTTWVDAGGGLAIPHVTADPLTPAIGTAWLRTDTDSLCFRTAAGILRFPAMSFDAI